MAAKCPNCNCGHCPVSHTYNRTFSLHGKVKTVVRRRRVCRYCGATFTTVEFREEDLIESEPKQEGSKNPYLSNES